MNADVKSAVASEWPLWEIFVRPKAGLDWQSAQQASVKAALQIAATLTDDSSVEFEADDVPITSVTNGVHAPTWTDPAMLELALDKFGTVDTTAVDWASTKAVSDADLWAVRGRMREQLVHDARRRVSAAWQTDRRGAGGEVARGSGGNG